MAKKFFEVKLKSEPVRLSITLSVYMVTFLLSMHFPFLYVGFYAAAIIVTCALLGCRHLFTNVHLTAEAAESTTSGKSTWSYYTNPIVLLIGLMCFIMFVTSIPRLKARACPY